MARQELFSPVNAFIKGRAARQDYDYGQTRNALAQTELADAPAQMQRRNALADLQLRGAQQDLEQGQYQIDAAKAKDGYTRLRQALDSGNPRAYVLQHEPELAAKLQQQGLDLNSVDDESAKAVIDGFAREYAGKAGIAPSAPESYTLKPGEQRFQGGKVVASVPGNQENGYTLSPGQRRYGPDGKLLASAPNDPRQTAPNWTRVEQTLPDGKVQVGFVDTNSPNPEATFRPLGSPSNTAKDPKITEGERVAANYLLRMESAEQGIGAFKPTTKDFLLYNKALNSGDVVAYLANSNMSPEGQRYFQYVTDWSRAKLRKESGAVISPSEIIGEVRTYFPSAGDSDSMVKQKQGARKVAVDGMRVMAGGAAKQAHREAPSAAIEHLRQHPELKEQFKAKYGYLPDGL